MTHSYKSRGHRRKISSEKKARARRRNCFLLLLFLAAVFFSTKHCIRKFQQLYAMAANMQPDTEKNVSSPDTASYEDQSAYVISISGLSQEGIPTGCEAVSTVCVLRYWEIDITPDTFIREYLPCQEFRVEGKTVYGPDPDEFFAGDPYSTGSLGCFSNVICKALNAMKEASYPKMESIQILVSDDLSLDSLTDTYVSKGIPVILWITMDMQPTYDGMEYHLDDGTLYTWPAREHCMVLCGYSDRSYYFMDPLSDGEILSYEKKLSQTRFEAMGQQAVVLVK